MKEEIIECKEDGTIIGPIDKLYAHSKEIRPIKTHYSTWAMIYNPVLKKYGLQLKRIKSYDGFKDSKWDMGVAGHNCYIEKEGKKIPLLFDENLVKETDEEIGLDVKMHSSLNEFLEASKNLKGTIGYIFEEFHYKDSRNSEWVGGGFILTTETELNFKDEEVLEFRWMSPSELKKYLKDEKNYYAAFPVIFEKAEKFRLEYLK